MKRPLFLIPTVGIFTFFTTAIFVSAPKSASAYCVHNLTGSSIKGWDIRNEKDYFINPAYWKKTLGPDQRDCCPGKFKECKNAEIYIQAEPNGNGLGSCQMRPGNHGLVEVRYRDRLMVCTVR
jgi:hypothetical protein